MMTDHLRKVVDQLAEQPPEVQEKFATEIESELRERARIAAQLADPNATDLNHLLEEADREIAAGQVTTLNEWLDER